MESGGLRQRFLRRRVNSPALLPLDSHREVVPVRDNLLDHRNHQVAARYC